MTVTSYRRLLKTGWFLPVPDELLDNLSKAVDSAYFPHLSLFGDAAINVIAGRRLPAIEALRVDVGEAPRFTRSLK